MINLINRDLVIGIKKLSIADLGISETSNLTHIGLFEDTLKYSGKVYEKQKLPSQLIYGDKVYDLLSILTYIKNPDGTYRSPKINTGLDEELTYENKSIGSVVRQIRELASSNLNYDWYLLWIRLESDELVFLLLRKDSNDYSQILKIIGQIGDRRKINRLDNEFNQLVQYLNNKIDLVNSDYYEELEISSQTGIRKFKNRIIPRNRDIEKANEIFAKTGRKGEELLNYHFEFQKRNNEIKNFKWLNKSRESSFPYDFEITSLKNKIIFSDAKSTRFKFEQEMVISSGELKFINQNTDKYLIHRLYSLDDKPKVRVCENIHSVSNIFLPHYDTFNNSMKEKNLKVTGLSLRVSPNLDCLNFSVEKLINK